MEPKSYGDKTLDLKDNASVSKINPKASIDQNVNETYEMRVNRNIKENKEFLRSLGIGNDTATMKSEKLGKTSKPKSVYGRRSILTPTRRSYRLLEMAPEKVDINLNDLLSFKTSREKRENIFGHIPGVPVGTEFGTRLEASNAGVHRPTVAGIHGSTEMGCYSIALSGGYEDDIDTGYTFMYTGEGGRDLKGTKANPKNLRTAPQSKDQQLERGNLALVRSMEHKRPVRVIRGYKLRSDFAPEEGYRYDGLYEVVSYCTCKGFSGFTVYKFHFQRMADQDPAPWLEGKENSDLSKKEESSEKDPTTETPMKTVNQ